MSAIQFVDAKREQSRLRLAMMGPAGAGKTYSLLLMMKGIVGDWAKVFLIDTERGSAALYEHLCGDGPRFKVFRMDAPYSPARYRDAIKAAEEAGAQGIIIDSLSHAWEGEGGALDRVDAASSKSGNSYTAWKDVTPDHRSMVDAILQSPCHVACAMRSKQEYVLEPNDKGKMVPRRVGLAPVQRSGMEFEFTIFLDIDDSHFATATKDRTGLLDGKRFKPTVEAGQAMKKWLEQGSAPVQKPPVQATTPPQGQAPGAPAPSYHPDANDGPEGAQGEEPEPWDEPGGLALGVKTMGALSDQIKNMKTRAEGAALWDAVTKAAPIIGPPATATLKNELKAKAATLTQ